MKGNVCDEFNSGIKRSFTLFHGAYLIGSICDQVVYTLLAWNVTERYESHALAGFIISICTFMRFSFLFPCGALTDRIGGKTICIWTNILRFGLTTFLAIAESWESILVTAVGFALLGSIEALYAPSTQTLAVTVCGVENEATFHKAERLFIVTQKTVLVIAPFIAGFCIEYIGIPTILAFLSGGSLLALVMTSFVNTVDSKIENKAEAAYKGVGTLSQLRYNLNDGMAKLLLVIAISELSVSGITGTGYLLLVQEYGWSVKVLGYLLAAFGLGSVFGAAIAHSLVNTCDSSLIMNAALVAAGLCIVATPFTVGITQSVCLSIMIGLSVGIASSIALTRYVFESRFMGYGKANALLNAIVAIVAVPATIATGAFAEALSISLVFGIFGAVLVLAALLYWFS